MIHHLMEPPAIVEEANRLECREELTIHSVTLSYDKDGIARMNLPPGFGPTFDPREKYAEDYEPFVPQVYRAGESFVHNPNGLDADANDAQGSLKDNPEESKHGRT